MYPQLALAARVEGTDVLECTTDGSGRVAQVKVVRGHPLLDEAAVAAARQWVYEPIPAADGSGGLPFVVDASVTFSLRQDAQAPPADAPASRPAGPTAPVVVLPPPPPIEC